MKKWILFILGFMLISNIPFIKGLYSITIDEKHYRYSTINGTFTFSEFMDINYANMTKLFDRYKENNPNKDTVLYRLFSKNPLCYWRWAEYFYDKRYELPYHNWEEIKKRRGEVPSRTIFQHF